MLLIELDGEVSVSGESVGDRGKGLGVDSFGDVVAEVGVDCLEAPGSLRWWKCTRPRFGLFCCRRLICEMERDTLRRDAVLFIAIFAEKLAFPS